MTDNRLCYSILLLIDNTATMNRTTFESFPFISFAKSIVKLIVERSRSTKIRLIVVYSDTFGKPKSIYLNLTQPSIQFPPEISHLVISPCGIFDETVQEGLIQLNKMRYQNNSKEFLADPYFFPKKIENYSIMLFTDGWTLSHDFYKFQRINEYLIRFDENIYFCNICHSLSSDTTTNLTTNFSTAFEQLDMEPIPFYTSYSGTGSLMNKIFYPSYLIHFFLNFGSITVKAKIAINNLLWPFPYDPTVNSKGTVLPQYYCIHFDKPINVKRIKHTKYDISIKLENIEVGNYVVYDNDDNGVPFAIFAYEGDHAVFKLLPYNFMFLLQCMNPHPSKNDLDEYLAKLPPPYYEGVTNFFKESGFEFTSIATKTKKEYLKRLRDREEYYNGHIQENYGAIPSIQLDPSRFSRDSLLALLDTMPNARKSFLIKKTPSKITINKDTIDDEKTFQSLDIVSTKIRPTIIYQRTQSPIQDNFIKSVMPRLKTATPEEQATEIANVKEVIETLFEEDSESDNISMLEDLLILLRDKESYELERRLKKMKENGEFFSFVKGFLLNSIKRFKIENLPQSLNALLNSPDSTNN